MSGRINQPVGQIKLTNVAVVRLARGGKRFEIACYRNKVVNWRQGLEVDLDEVLQTDNIFVNVSKGEFASSDLLKKHFGTTDQEEIAKLILDKGDMQVSDLERSQRYESMQREIATQISEQCVNPSTGYPYTVAQIRQAMKEANYILHPTRSIKRQYLDCVKLIQSKGVLKLERAKMELALIVDESEVDDVVMEMKQMKIPLPQSTEGGKITILVDPSLYRPLQDLVKSTDNGRLEILQQVVKREGDSSLMVENDVNNNSNDLHSVGALSSRFQTSALSVHHDDEEEATSLEAQVVPAKKSNRKKTKKEKRREKEQAESEAQRRREQQYEEARILPSHKPQSTTVPINSTSSGGGAIKSCNTCGGSFSPAEYRCHFRSDWHRYNQKLKLKGMAPISEQEFLACDADAFFSDFQ